MRDVHLSLLDFLAALLVACGALSAEGQTPAPAEIKPRLADKSAVEWKATAIDGSEIDLAKLRGKVVLLDFWATRCPPCVTELPNVLVAYKKFHAQGFEIIGISSDENKEVLLRFIKAHEI